MTDRKTMTDVELCQGLVPQAVEHYARAIDVMTSYPDYALTQFRIVVEYLVATIAERFKLDLANKVLFESINELHACQLIDQALCSDMHQIRLTGNTGVHRAKEESSLGVGDLDTAVSMRKVLVRVLESVFLILKKGQRLPDVDLVEVGDKTSQKILWDAVTSLDFKTKMAAGLILEAHTLTPSEEGAVVLQRNEEAHKKALERMAAEMYWAACQISAKLDYFSFSEIEMKGGAELWFFKRGDLEALYRFSMLSYEAEGWGDLQRLGGEALKWAAVRKHPPACSIYADVLRKEGRYEEALDYLQVALLDEDLDSYAGLALLYSDIKSPLHSKEKAEHFLCEGRGRGNNHCTYLLGRWLFDGELLDQDTERAVMMLKEAAEAGHQPAKVFLKVGVDKDFELAFKAGLYNLLAGFPSLEEPKPEPPPRKMKRNEPCYCRSGKKYKLCCGR